MRPRTARPTKMRFVWVSRRACMMNYPMLEFAAFISTAMTLMNASRSATRMPVSMNRMTDGTVTRTMGSHVPAPGDIVAGLRTSGVCRTPAIVLIRMSPGSSFSS